MVEEEPVVHVTFLTGLAKIEVHHAPFLGVPGHGIVVQEGQGTFFCRGRYNCIGRHAGPQLLPCLAAGKDGDGDIGPHKTHLFLYGPVKLHCAAATEVHIVPVGAFRGGICLHDDGIHALRADLFQEVVDFVCRLGI